MADREWRKTADFLPLGMGWVEFRPPYERWAGVLGVCWRHESIGAVYWTDISCRTWESGKITDWRCCDVRQWLLEKLHHQQCPICDYPIEETMIHVHGEAYWLLRCPSLDCDMHPAIVTPYGRGVQYAQIIFNQLNGRLRYEYPDD